MNRLGLVLMGWLMLLGGCGPQTAESWIERGDDYLFDEEYSQAVTAYTQAIQLDPKNTEAYFSRGLALENSRDYAGAIADYRRTLQIDDSYTQAHNSLAWVLATCPDATLRNGREALEHAQKSRQFGSDWMYDDTLAAAHAELGQFDEAVKAQQTALDAAVAEDADEEDLVEIRARLKLYREKKPYRE